MVARRGPPAPPHPVIDPLIWASQLIQVAICACRLAHELLGSALPITDAAILFSHAAILLALELAFWNFSILVAGALRSNLMHAEPMHMIDRHAASALLTCSYVHCAPGRGTLAGIIGWVLRHRKALLVSYLALTHILIYHLIWSSGCASSAPALVPAVKSEGDLWLTEHQAEAREAGKRQAAAGEQQGVTEGGGQEAETASFLQRQAKLRREAEHRCGCSHAFD